MSGLQRGSWQLSVTKIWGSIVRRQGSRLGGFNGAIQFKAHVYKTRRAIDFYRFVSEGGDRPRIQSMSFALFIENFPDWDG